MGKAAGNSLRPWAYLASFGMSGFSLGLTTCINTLIFLSRGLSLSLFSLAIGLNFITVMTLEMPSGIAGDLWGRKRVWMISRVMTLASLACYTFGNVPVVLLGSVLSGAGIAFSSGTLDALYMERWMHQRGEKTLGNAQMWYSTVQYSCQAMGSLTGGLLSSFSFWNVSYGINLTAAFALTAVTLVWAGILIPEDVVQRQKLKNSAVPLSQMLEQGKKAMAAARKSPVLMVCLIGAVVMGFTTSGIELYWQPHLETLAENREIGFLLGLLSFAGMAAVVLGSVVSGKLSPLVKTGWGQIRVYLAARLAMALVIIAAALWLRLSAFCLLYTLYYLVMGCQDTMDAVLLQSNARDEMRGTLMSVQSFALRMGGLVSQLLSAAVLAFLGIPVLWLLLAAVFLLGSSLCGIYYRSRAEKRTKNEMTAVYERENSQKTMKIKANSKVN